MPAGAPSSSRAGAGTWLVLIVAAVAAVVGGVLLLGSRGDGGPQRAARAGTAVTEATAEAPPSTLPPGTVVVAEAIVPELAVYDRPTGGTPTRTLENPIATGGPLVLLTDGRIGDDRVKVSLPVRPNGSTGWVDAVDVRLLTNAYRVRVDLSDREVRVFERDREVLSTAAAIGSDVNPTPVGRYFVTELLIQPNPRGAYGPFAFGLSAFSETLSEFNGGQGQVGMHGTNDPSSIGRPVSHGCIRLPNDVLTRVRSFLPLGTPVEISA